MELSLFLQLTVNGLLLGGFYALMSAGFSLTWGVMGLANLAHGGFLLLGALLVWSLQNAAQPAMQSISAGLLVAFALALGFVLGDFLLRPFSENIWNRRAVGYLLSTAISAVIYVLWSASAFSPFNPLLSLPIIATTFFGAGYLLQSALLNRLVGAPYFKALLVLFALKVMLEQGALMIYKTDMRTLAFGGGFWRIAQSDVTVSENRLAAFIVSALALTGLSLFLRRTRAGYAVRAAAQHPMAARLVGINLPRIYAITFGVALALTGVAGVLLGTFQPFAPDLGLTWTLRACAVAVLSGFMPVENILIGGVLIGLSEVYLGAYAGMSWPAIVPLLALILLLLIRPQRMVQA